MTGLMDLDDIIDEILEYNDDCLIASYFGRGRLLGWRQLQPSEVIR